MHPGRRSSVAAGPVSRTSSAETDALLRAEILSWSRTRGAFAGISLKGATLRPDEEVNRSLYGKELTNREIVEKDVEAPKGAGALLGLLNKYSSRK
ncbi:MAG: lipid-binding SYLF domain-containing protein [Bryobacteraceae bacterium]